MIKKKVGILTFHASHNYGSMLQAYALQTYIRSLGVDVEEINLRINAQKKMYANPLRYWGPKSLIERVKHPRRELDNILKWYKFESFLESYIQHTEKEYHSWNEIVNHIPFLGYNAIISGGDQIWNTWCTDFSESYYLPSELCDVKKIAYSPSFGGEMSRFQNAITKEFIKENLNQYEILSVRDNAGKQFLENLLGKTVPVVPDPTFLLSLDEWDRIIPKERIIDGDYVLYYSPFSSRSKEDLAMRIGRMVNCPIVTTNASSFTDKSIIEYNNCGPLQFLNILKHAKYVCGNSYHLVVFSILFHKSFWAIGGNTDARMVGILSLYGLENRGIALNCIDISQDPIDFAKTDEILCSMRKQGQSFIRDALA